MSSPLFLSQPISRPQSTVLRRKFLLRAILNLSSCSKTFIYSAPEGSGEGGVAITLTSQVKGRVRE